MSWKTFWTAFGVTVSVLVLAIWIDMVQHSNAEAADPSLREQLKLHQQVLDAMSEYFSKLQAKHILPKPDEIEKFQEPQKKGK